MNISDESSPPEHSDTPHADGDADDGSRAPRWPLPSLLSWTGDLVAVGLLAWVLVWFAGRDGGFESDARHALTLALPLAGPMAAVEIGRLGRTAAALTAAWLLGWLLAFGFALERSQWLADGELVALAPLVFAAAVRVWKRPWGPVALVALLALAWGRFAWDALLKWWGWTQLGVQPRWDVLSWRNQSGALTGSFGLLFLGLTLRGRRTLPLVAGAVSALGFAGLWLSSSRAATGIFLATAGLLVGATAWSAVRRSEGRTGRAAIAVAGRAGFVALASVAMTLGLLSMLPAGTVSPLESRDQDAGNNLAARMEHMEAAAGMFLDRPWAGQGPGSYRIMARMWNDPEGNLTSAAHNEWLEALAEGGLLHGGAAVGAAAAALVVVWRRGRRWITSAAGQPDDAVVASSWGIDGLLPGAMAVVIALGAHATLDFDFHYATLLAVFLVSLGMLVARHDESAVVENDAGGSGPATGVAAVIVTASCLAGMLGVVVAGTWVTERQGDLVESTPDPAAAADALPRWQTARLLFLAERVDPAQARELLEDGRRWNPGDPRLRVGVAILDFEQGRIGGTDLVAALDDPPTHLVLYAQVAQALHDGGESELADVVATEAIGFLDVYARWGVTETVTAAWEVRIRAAAVLGRCDDVPGWLDEIGRSTLAESASSLTQLRSVADIACG